MPPDILEALRDAADEPASALDMQAVHRRARYLRRRRAIARGGAALLTAAIVASGTALTISGSTERPSVQTGGASSDPGVYKNRKAGYSLHVPPTWSWSPSAQDQLPSFYSRVTICNESIASISLYELRGDTRSLQISPRPQTFGPTSGTTMTGTVSDGCTRSASQVIFFSDKGRSFQAFVNLHPDASSEARAEAYATLNSLRFVRGKHLVPPTATTKTRPANAEIRILVLNGSGVPNAAATKANELRGLGYAAAGTGDAVPQDGTTVACRDGFESAATRLAEDVGTGTSVATFPATPPEGAENADCIVTLGS
jgi:hypothetical protein